MRPQKAWPRLRTTSQRRCTRRSKRRAQQREHRAARMARAAAVRMAATPPDKATWWMLSSWMLTIRRSRIKEAALLRQRGRVHGDENGTRPYMYARGESGFEIVFLWRRLPNKIITNCWAFRIRRR